MNDFDYSGYGLFESLASDQQEERRAQRKALVTAQARVEDNLGRFFAASKSGPEFDERYALVQQEFVATVREAAEEYGVNSESVANAIFSHYRTAAYKLAEEHKDKDDEDSEPIDEPAESEDDDEDDFDKDDTDTWHQESSVHTDAERSSDPTPLARTADGGDKGECSECNNEGFLKGGVCGPCRGKRLHDNEDPADRGDREDKEDQSAGLDEGLGYSSSLRWAAEGADDKDSSDQETVDLPSAKEDSNTGLGGPSPKIDRGQAGHQDDIEVPSKQHPTERIDVTKALPRTNETELKGIGEQTTESQDLPTSTNADDAGFAGPNQEQAPHTDTWGGEGQVEPVTSEALASMRWAAFDPSQWECPQCGERNVATPYCRKCQGEQPAEAPAPAPVAVQ